MELNLPQYFDPSAIPPAYNILVLNQEIVQPHFKILYERASLKVCADGGYHQLKKWIESNGQKITQNQPDFVIGDFDSIDNSCSVDGAEDILKKPKFVHIYDQNRTDLEKSIDFIIQKVNFNPQVFILIGALGGRFDHEIGSLSALFKYSEHLLILLNNQSAVTLLKPVCIRYLSCRNHFLL